MNVKSIAKKVVTPVVNVTEKLEANLQVRSDIRRGKNALKEGMRKQFLHHGTALREREEAEEAAKKAAEIRAKLEEELASITVMGTHVAS